MRELGIRQWWLAEQLRVDRKTISRWMSGKVKKISVDNLTNLAGILGCHEDDLTTSDPTQVFASVDDQTKAAKLIDEKALIEILAPSGQWDLMEALIRAVMRPELPLYMLGQLYNNLAIAAWRRNQLAVAEEHAKAALALGERCDNLSVTANANLNLGTVQAIKGHIAASIGLYKVALEHLNYLGESLEVGKALSNLGTNYMDYGDHLLCVEFQDQAIKEFFNITPPPDMNISIAYTNKARSELALGIKGAEDSAKLALMHAERGKYLRGIAFCHLLLGEIAATARNYPSANNNIQKGLSLFQQQGIDEPLSHLIAARTARLSGAWDTAREHVTRGLNIQDGSPVDLALLYVESAMVSVKNDVPGFRDSIKLAISIFERCGCASQINHCYGLAASTGITLG